MSRANKLGLKRNIPQNIKKEIRRRSKNGCVICRNLVYDYEHIDPFNNVLTHSPDTMCLLCPQHHAEVTRGRLSKFQIQQAYEKVQFDESIKPPSYKTILSNSLKLGLGDALFEYMPDNSNIIEYDGIPILKVGYITDELFGGSRPSITGNILDEFGNSIVSLNDNEIMLKSDNVEIEFVGGKLTIFKDGRKSVLEVTFDPPSGIRFNRLRMRYSDLLCEMDENFGLTLPTTDGLPISFLVNGVETKGATSAIKYCSDRSKWNNDQIKLIGDVGILVPNTGAIIAAGAELMCLKSILIKGIT